MTGDNVEQAKTPGVKRYDALAAAAWIPEMVDRIVDQFDPAKIILFGSHARGDAHCWSDIDFLVVFAAVQDKRGMTISLRKLLRDLPVPKDIVVTDDEEIAQRKDKVGSVLRPALREGKVMYERQQSTT
jgi:uncharacterized protein